VYANITIKIDWD